MLHVKYFNLNTIQQTWHRITVNISAIFIPFFLKSFLRWYDFSLQRYLDSKGKIISNVSLSLSHSFAPRYWQLHACHACTGQWRTSSTLFFFFSTSTRRDVRISREKLGHSVFFFFLGMAVVIQDFRLRSTSRLICRISRAIWVIDFEQNAF